MSRKYLLEFQFDENGYGLLRLHNGSIIVLDVLCRTGSRNTVGTLVNAIAPGVWTIRKPSKSTTEKAMVITHGRGWKIRMWTPAGEWSHYLIHPDGNLPGTKGCIGIQNDDAVWLRERFDHILKSQKQIEVFVNTPLPHETGPTRRVLCLPGGGVMGMIQVMSLMEIEKVAGRSCHQIFDLIVGTSVGAITGALVASGMTAGGIHDLMLATIPRMFRRHFGWPRYRREPFEKVWLKTVGDIRMKELKTKFVCTSVNECDGRTHFFKSWEKRDGELRLLEAVERSFAAPVYFGPMVDVPNKAVWVDGGTGVSNYPLPFSMVEIVRQKYLEEGHVHLLCLGTGHTPFSIPFKRARRRWFRNMRSAFWFMDPADGGLARNQSRIERVAAVSSLSDELTNFTFQYVDGEVPKKIDKLDGVKHIGEYRGIGVRLSQQIDHDALVNNRP